MAIAGWLMRRIGVDACLALVLLAYTVRFLGYARLQPMPYTWAVLLFQTTHGLTFGLYWTVGTTWAAKCAPQGLEATLQAAFTMLVSAGQTLALVGGGYLYERHGGAQLYGGACVAAAGIGLVAILLLLTSARPSEHQRRLPSSAEEVQEESTQILKVAQS
uniref:Major facilitator superfamily (MFS) profile domain-containing protein n=1 Tax=Calcidiscus leptoporus TaxID=127549 RepID=A0A7S0P327_9EUKA|mmetsp:Transcript_49266/g.113876  ORF Transcript_49266/g.113876 Transcript_49266/m.113876 type:complete len:161 (+) Transcript_49266:237-719(+)